MQNQYNKNNLADVFMKYIENLIEQKIIQDKSMIIICGLLRNTNRQRAKQEINRLKFHKRVLQNVQLCQICSVRY